MPVPTWALHTGPYVDPTDCRDDGAFYVVNALREVKHLKDAVSGAMKLDITRARASKRRNSLQLG